MFTIKEFCEYARISRTTLYRLMKAGEGPPATRIRGSVLISKTAAAKWLKRLESAA